MKTAIVTGASSGLGQALAVELAKAGYRQALIGRNQSKLKETLNFFPNEILSKSCTISGDLSKLEDCSNLVSRCLEQLDSHSVDLLVNCAGFATSGRIEDIPTQQFVNCWNVNFASAVSLIQQVIPVMKRQQSGCIVNISSGVASRALPFLSPYCSAKAALNSFSESLRVEIKPFGIHVLLFSPGPIESGFKQAAVHCGNTLLHLPALNGKTPEWVAAIAMDAIGRKKERVLLGSKARLTHHLNHWSPAIVDRIICRMFRLEEIEQPRPKKVATGKGTGI